MNSIPYVPRHAGETPEAAARSRAERDRGDFDNAQKACRAVGTIEALSLGLRLAAERSRRLAVRVAA